MQLLLETPPGITNGPVYAEGLLRTLHQAMNRELTTLSFVFRDGLTALAVEAPSSLRNILLQELQDAYPGLKVHVLAEANTTSENSTWSASLRVTPDVFSIRTWKEFEDGAGSPQRFADPVAATLSAMRMGNTAHVHCSVDLSIRPAARSRLRSAERVLRNLSRVFLTRQLQRVYRLNATSDKWRKRAVASVCQRFSRAAGSPTAETTPTLPQPQFECWLNVQVTAPLNAEDAAQRKLRQICSVFARYESANAGFVQCSTGGTSHLNHGRRGFLLSSVEVATIWHPVTAVGDTVSRVRRPDFREIEPPRDLASGKEDATILGRTEFRNQRSQFPIEADDLRRHLFVAGKTGCGKSTFLFNLMRQQIEHGRGTILIDPHGDLSDQVLNAVPSQRTNDVIVFDAADYGGLPAFNPMLGPLGIDDSLIADGVLTSFMNVFGLEAGSAPRLLHIFRNCLLTLVGTPHASLCNVQRLLVDSNYRKTIVSRVGNAAVREFWVSEFNRWNDRDRTQYIASLQNKLGAFSTNERLQKILNPTERGIQLRTVMDESKILICNLSKGRIGNDASTLLGSLLLSSLQVAAMSRANVPEVDRPDCVVAVDEFHSYLADGNTTMAAALAESRKYRTSYVLSTQLLEQLDSATLAGVLGNCGSTLCMTVGPRDASVLSELLGNGLDAEDLMRIPKYHAYVRLLIKGAPHTFSMTTLPPPKRLANRADIVRKVSQQRYGQKSLSPSIRS